MDELEKENKRLAKDAQEYEKKWKHTEEELEDLREASGEVAELKSRAQKADAQIEELNKIVDLHLLVYFTLHADYVRRNRRILLFNVRIPSYSPSPPNDTSPHPAKQLHPVVP